MNLLVLCTGNSARSILLESIFNTTSQGRITAYSAGSQPTGQVHPQSLRLLSALGHDTDQLRSKSWDVFAADNAPHLDVVLTVCASAAGETCPYFPGRDGATPLRAHWGVEDPAKAPPSDWERAFQTAYDTLARRAQALLAEPFENLSTDELKATLTRIGDL